MPRSVLVVDDDASFRQLAIGLVRSWGHDVVAEAGNVAEAVQRAGELQPDIMLVDISLPDGDGFAVLAQIRLLACQPRIVLISSDPDATTGTEARRAGALGFIPKSEMPDSGFRQMLDG